MRKYFKKMTAIIMSIVVLVCILPGVNAEAVTQNSVTSQLNTLINQYANRTATSSQMYMGSQCKGFANWVFKKLFGVYIGPYPENANYKITDANARLVGLINPGGLTESSSRALLQKAKPGDYIQVQRSIAKSGGRCGPHSMIVVGVRSDGVQVFDCNSDGRNTIKTYVYTWSKFDYDNRAMSLYHAYDYQEDSPAQPVTPSLPAVSLHVWFSLKPMGEGAGTIRLNDTVYLCYRMETTDGKLLDSSLGNYSVKETIYFPDGSTFPYSYGKSTDNWISTGFNKWGTYRGVVEVSGDYNIRTEVSHTLKEPGNSQVHTWFSSTEMGSRVSSLEKGKSYYLCYELLCDNGYLNNYVNMNYTVTQEVYGPDGKKVFGHTYEKSDNNWIRFTASQAGNYKGKTIIKGDLNYTHEVTYMCKDTTPVKETPKEAATITYDANGGTLSKKTQSGTKNSYVTLLAEQPKKSIRVTFDANGGMQAPDAIVLQQSFKGWVDRTKSSGECYAAGSRFLLKGSCTLTAAYEDAVLQTLPEIKRNGYRFDGWYTAGGQKAYAGMRLGADTKLTARWVKENDANQEIPGETDIIDNGEADGDDLSDEEDNENEAELTEVGDELATDEALYTVTKTGSTPAVTYTELFDEDIVNAVIPDTVTIDHVTYRVTAIGPKALYKNDSVKTLKIGKNVTKIGSKAFYGCSSLKRITITSEKIKSGGIGSKAFTKIAKKAKIYVPGTVYKVYKKILKKAGAGSGVKVYRMN